MHTKKKSGDCDCEEDGDIFRDEEDEEEDEIQLPVVMSKKERKRLEKLEKQRQKELKRRKATTVAKPKGSRVDLSMMRTTTGRQRETEGVGADILGRLQLTLKDIPHTNRCHCII